MDDSKSLPFTEDSVRLVDMDRTNYLGAYGQWRHCHDNRTGESTAPCHWRRQSSIFSCPSLRTEGVIQTAKEKGSGIQAKDIHENHLLFYRKWFWDTGMGERMGPGHAHIRDGLIGLAGQWNIRASNIKMKNGFSYDAHPLKYLLCWLECIILKNWNVASNVARNVVCLCKAIMFYLL